MVDVCGTALAQHAKTHLAKFSRQTIAERRVDSNGFPSWDADNPAAVLADEVMDATPQLVASTLLGLRVRLRQGSHLADIQSGTATGVA